MGAGKISRAGRRYWCRKGLGSRCGWAPELLKQCAPKSRAESRVKCECEKGRVLKETKKNFPIREAAVATPATKDEFQDARFIGPNYPSPCSDTVIATQTAVVRAASSSTRTLKSFRSNTRWRMPKLSGTFQSGSTPRCHRGAQARVHSEGEPLCRCNQSVSSRSTQRRPAGASVVSAVPAPRGGPLSGWRHAQGPVRL